METKSNVVSYIMSSPTVYPLLDETRRNQLFDKLMSEEHLFPFDLSLPYFKRLRCKLADKRISYTLLTELFQEELNEYKRKLYRSVCFNEEHGIHKELVHAYSYVIVSLEYRDLLSDYNPAEFVLWTVCSSAMIQLHSADQFATAIGWETLNDIVNDLGYASVYDITYLHHLLGEGAREHLNYLGERGVKDFDAYAKILSKVEVKEGWRTPDTIFNIISTLAVLK